MRLVERAGVDDREFLLADEIAACSREVKGEGLLAMRRRTSGETRVDLAARRLRRRLEDQFVVLRCAHQTSVGFDLSLRRALVRRRPLLYTHEREESDLAASIGRALAGALGLIGGIMNDNRRPTLAATLWPQQAASRIARFAALSIGGALALAISAKAQVPFYPVPMTLQTLVVLIIGAAFGARLAAATVALYLAEGLLGLQVFAGAQCRPGLYGGADGRLSPRLSRRGGAGRLARRARLGSFARLAARGDGARPSRHFRLRLCLAGRR